MTNFKHSSFFFLIQRLHKLCTGICIPPLAAECNAPYQDYPDSTITYA